MKTIVGQPAEMGILRGVHGMTLCGKVRGCEIDDAKP